MAERKKKRFFTQDGHDFAGLRRYFRNTNLRSITRSKGTYTRTVQSVYIHRVNIFIFVFLDFYCRHVSTSIYIYKINLCFRYKTISMNVSYVKTCHVFDTGPGRNSLPVSKINDIFLPAVTRPDVGHVVRRTSCDRRVRDGTGFHTESFIAFSCNKKNNCYRSTF